MFEIRKRFDFAASHQLRGLPDGHQCGRLHGHNYVVEVVLRSEELDARGFVVDYGELAALREELDHAYEHRHLNDIFEQPTAENIALVLYRFCKHRWPQTAAVRVSETPKTWAEYRED